MSYFLSKRLKEQYPEWHKQPFRLSNAEMERPEAVVTEFFEGYNLKQLRICMEELLYLIPPTAEGEVSFYLRFCREAEKMMEAVYVLYKEHFFENNKCMGLRTEQEAEEEPESVATKAEGVDRVRYYLDYIEGNPMSCLMDIFLFWGDDTIKDTVQEWFLLAVCSSEFNSYEDMGQKREELYLFCHALKGLIEAVYLIVCRHLEANNDEGALTKTENYLLLTEDEVVHPYKVLESFKQRFRLIYARAELWHLLDAVVSYKGDLPLKRGCLLFNYEIMLCIIKAAYLLREPEGERETTV